MRFRSIVNPLIHIQRVDGGIEYRFDLDEVKHVYILDAAQRDIFKGVEIVDLDGLIGVIKDLFQDVLGGYALKRPQIKIYLPYGLSSIQKNAYRQAFKSGGASSVETAYMSHDFYRHQVSSVKSGVLGWLDIYGSELLTIHEGRVIGTFALSYSRFNLAQAVIKQLKRSDKVRESAKNIELVFDFLANKSDSNGFVHLTLRTGEDNEFSYQDIQTTVGRAFDQTFLPEIIGKVKAMPVSIQADVAKKGMLIAGDSELVEMFGDTLQSKVGFSIIKLS